MASRLRNIVDNPDMTSTALVVLVTDRFGPDVLGWDPETVQLELKELGNVPAASFNKLMAGITIITTDGFYSNLPIFITLCNALYDGTVQTRVFDPADMTEMATAVAEAYILWPPDGGEEMPFNEEIVGYMGAVADQEGLLGPPDILSKLIPGVWDQVSTMFTDDPTMFAAVHSLQKDRLDEINQEVKNRLALIVTQLEGLPLTTGSASGLIKKLQSVSK